MICIAMPELYEANSAPVRISVPPAFLVVPLAGDRTFAAARRKLRLLGLRILLSIAVAELPRALAASVARLQSVLASMARIDSAAVLEAIGSVDVMTRLLLISRGFGSVADHLSVLVPHLLVRLAERGVPESIVWDQPVTRFADRSRGVFATFEPPARAMIVSGRDVELGLAGGARAAWPIDGQAIAAPSLHRCHADLPALFFSTTDTNPLAMDEAHPDKHGNAVDLGGRHADEWISAIRDALEVVRIALPAWWEELPLSLERLVPVGYEAEKHLSASYEEAPGLAYISLHPDVLTMAEAIVHETQHGKLNVLRWLDPVLLNGLSTWTKSPVRPDMRPLMGVLMAAHAFVPIAVMHARLCEVGHPIARTHRFEERRREVLASNAEALAVVREKAEPTEPGRRLIEDLAATQAAVTA